MARGWRFGVAAAMVLSSLALGACDDLDDTAEDEDEPVTQAEYDAEAARVCDRFGERIIALAEATDGGESDAQRISFIRAEFVPQVRTIVRSLETFGYPPEQAAAYNRAEAVALNLLEEIEDEAPELVDRLMAGTMLPEEDPFVRLEEAFAALGVPC